MQRRHLLIFIGASLAPPLPAAALGQVGVDGQSAASAEEAGIVATLMGYVTPAAAVSGVIGVYGAISDAQFQASVSHHLRNIRAELRAVRRELLEVSRKLDTVLDLLRALPSAFAELLDDQSRRDQSNQMLGREDAIFSRVESMLGRRVTNEDRSSLHHLADDQAVARSSLSRYGVGVYPFVARAFASEALALRATRNSRRLFEERRDQTAASLNQLAEQGEAAAVERDAIEAGLRTIWAERPIRVYLGRYITESGGHIINHYVYSELSGDYEAGITGGRLVHEPRRDRSPKSPYLTYPRVELPPGAHPARHALLKAKYAELRNQGIRAAAEAVVFRAHRDASRDLASSVAAMTY